MGSAMEPRYRLGVDVGGSSLLPPTNVYFSFPTNN